MTRYLHEDLVTQEKRDFKGRHAIDTGDQELGCQKWQTIGQN